MKIIFDDITKICVELDADEKVNEFFDLKEFSAVVECDGDYLLYR